MPELITVQVGYYAAFREKSGVSRETIKTDALTTADLYNELRARYGFTLPVEAVRVAINQEFTPMDTPITNGVEVVFIPPVAGG